MGTGDPAPFPLPPASPRAQPHPQNRVLRDEMRSSIPGTSEAGSAGHLSSGCPLILRSEASVPLPPGGRHPASAEPPCQGYTLTLLDPLVCSAQCSVSLMQICKEGLIKVRRRDTGKLLSPARPAKLFNLLLSCASWELQKGWLTSEALTEGKGEDTQGRRPCEDRGRAQSEASTSHGCPGWPGAHRSPESRKEHPLEPPEGARPCRLLGFGLLSRLCRCVVDLTKTVLSCDRFRMEQAEHQCELQE